MSIEIRQLVIKSNVVQSSAPEHAGTDTPEQQAALKEEILAECKRMVSELLDARGDR